MGRQKYLNQTDTPGLTKDIDCISNEIIVLRCCIGKEVSKIAKKWLYGVTCSNKYLQNLRYRQLLLKELMCVNFDLLDQECLEESEIAQIINYLKTNCTECNPFNVN